MTPTLTDGVVTLRAHREVDLERLVEQSNDPAMARWTTVPAPYTLEDAKRFVRHTLPDGWASDREWGFAVEHEGRFVGTVILRNRDQRRGEVAFGSHPDARGRGLLSRALRLLLRWGFAPASEGGRDLHTVAWLAHRGNWDSRRLAWSVGFTMHDTWPRWLDDRGTMVDAWTATLQREEPLAPRSPWLEAVTITGERVVLRALHEQDLPRVVETLEDPETQRWHERPRLQAPHSLESQADFVLQRLEQAASGQALHWAVTDPATDLYLGQMTLFGVQHRRQAELSYWTHPDARGRGLTQEAARLVVRHCFVAWEDGGLGLRRLVSDADPDNGASCRVLERAGFVRTGLDRAAEPRPDGTWADQARYDLLATEVSAG